MTETYYVAGGRYGRKPTYHTDPNCTGLAPAHRVDERRVADVDADQVCTYCAEDREPEQNGGNWEYQRALKNARGESA